MIFLKTEEKLKKKLEFSGFYDKFPENPHRKIKKREQSWEILEKNAAERLLSINAKKC